MQSARTRFLPKALAVELRRLPWRLFGLCLLALAVAGALALLSWSFTDPSASNATKTVPHNLLGYKGAGFAAFMMEGFGLASPFLLLPLAAFGLQIAYGTTPSRLKVRFLYWAGSLIVAPAFFASLPAPAGWPLRNGLGGMFGDFASAVIGRLSAAVPPPVLWPLSALIFFVVAAWCIWHAIGLSPWDFLLAFQEEDRRKATTAPEEFGVPPPKGLANRLMTLAKNMSPPGKEAVPPGPREFWMTSAKGEPVRTEPVLSSQPPSSKPAKESPPAQAPADAPASVSSVAAKAAASVIMAAKEKLTPAMSAAEDLASFQSSPNRGQKPGGSAHSAPESEPRFNESTFEDYRIEPFFGPKVAEWPSEGPEGGANGGGKGPAPAPASPFLRLTAQAAKIAGIGAPKIFASAANGAGNSSPSAGAREPIKNPRNTFRVVQAPAPALALDFDSDPDLYPDILEESGSVLPPVSLLKQHVAHHDRHDAADPAHAERAEALTSVLADFGVKGRISGIYPGPVITLFELEPVRGTKSSRVVSLADDIARSMSAVSARIAVVPGRDAIGIELPNARREIVTLREILESSAFQNSQAALPLALGKTIGGEPIAVDLARMPHLLIAGTTGSGKSVGINTMILSLLFRLPPSQCNFIMIDPKMLELSVYDGIPHLLAPVVTDPRKAVVALKWAVKEMNSRYERMSRLGVRNVTSYNEKVAAAQLRGQPLKRTIQTGFHPISGEPIEEEEIMEAISMPYLVIVIDEMADLMMCAGKDVEFAVQRLSQMARAAGIHLIMATQRPSVDVVTGTIKANFPSRISFQVTSKIDSRTIIGEQGAEQLLGAGDMLYMASGGRIMRAHGPFVSDDEVEAVARYLKAQGFPNYRDDILEDSGGFDDGPPSKGSNGKDADLYGQAVEIVLKDRKPTASYLQRRLNIGYNRAASLIERMEDEGIVGAPGRTGRREILADAGR
jgi:DNA segregation ATPase FtsK/SpoIIIE, S-DNA-T family